MKNEILIIVDNNDGGVLQKYGKEKFNKHACEILTLGFTKVVFCQKNEDLIKQYLDRYSFIDLSKYYRTAQKMTREYCLRLKYTLPRKKIYMNKCLLDLMCFKDFNAWWFTTFSEMGSFRIKLIDQIYYLSLIQLVLKNEYRYIYIDIKDFELKSVLEKYLKRENICYSVFIHRRYAIKTMFKESFLVWWFISLSHFIFFQLLKTGILKFLNIGFAPQRYSRYLLLFSFFPSHWSINNGKKCSNKIFDAIDQQIHKNLFVQNIVYSGNIQSLIHNIRINRNNIEKKKIIFLERYLSFKDLLFFLSFQYVSMILKYRFLFSLNIKERYNKYDISSLVKKTLNASLFDNEFFRDVLIYYAFRNLLIKYNVKGIAHPSEFQCFEKAIWYTAKNVCPTFAFQHSANGKNWLNYYFDPDDIPSQLRGKQPLWDMPLPDMYLTSGDYPYRVMLKNNIPKQILKICGAIRYNMLSEPISNQNVKKIRKKYNISLDIKVMLIFSGVNENESLDMINNIIEYMEDCHKEVLILFKSHPLKILDEKVENILKKEILKQRLEVLPVNVDYFEFISLADVTCFCNSTIGIESIALGTHAISFDNIHSMVSYDIIEVGNAVFHVKNSDDFKYAINLILCKDDKLKEIEKLWPQAIKDTFYKLDGKSHERFFDHISTIIR